jgi:hypothetical protein
MPACTPCCEPPAKLSVAVTTRGSHASAFSCFCRPTQRANHAEKDAILRVPHLPVSGLHSPTLQSSSSPLQSASGPATHCPVRHRSDRHLPLLPPSKLQLLLSGLFSILQPPVDGSHTLVWHWLAGAGQITGLPEHVPPEHVSCSVHLLPSLQVSPACTYAAARDVGKQLLCAMSGLEKD